MLVLSIEIKVAHSCFSIVIAVILVIDKRLFFNLVVVNIIQLVLVVVVNTRNNPFFLEARSFREAKF
jgi:hypothetical protein